MNLRTLDACIAADIPVFLWGSPGSGKSSAVRRWAEGRDYRLTQLGPSVLDPTDLLGLPCQSGDGATRFAVPDWVRAILSAPDRRHLVFLDELNLASASVMSACLRLVLERAVHTTALPEGVRFAATGIHPSEAPTAQSLAAPMANRFAHIEWKGLSGSEWMSAMIADWPLPVACSPSDIDWHPIVAAFVDARPAMADCYAPGEGWGDEDGRAYPTARSWSALCRALPFAGSDEDLRRSTAEAVIGQRVAREFIAFVRAGSFGPAGGVGAAVDER